MVPEPVPHPARVLGECDIYPAPCRWISFPIGWLFAECTAAALICTSQTSRLLPQPIPPTWFGGAHPAVRGAGASPRAASRCLVSPTLPGLLPSAATGPGAHSPFQAPSWQPFCVSSASLSARRAEVRDAKGWELPAPCPAHPGECRGLLVAYETQHQGLISAHEFSWQSCCFSWSPAGDQQNPGGF